MSDVESTASVKSDEDVTQDEEYVVEKIVGKKVDRGTTLYLLKWKGYNDDENTWEPRDNLDCPELIEAYEEEEKEKKRKAAEKKKSTSKAAPKKTNVKVTARRKRATANSDSDDAKSLIQLSDSDEPKASSSRAKPVKKTLPKRNRPAASDTDDDASKASDSNSESGKKSRGMPAKKTKMVSSDSEDERPNVKKTPVKKPVEKKNLRRSSSKSSEKDSGTEDAPKPADKTTLDKVMDNDYEPEKIIGATESQGELMFLVKWKNMSKADLISAKIAKIACPQTIIAFFEERITWDNNKSVDKINLS